MEQNVSLLLLFSTLNGIGNTLSAVVLIVEDDRNRREETTSKIRNVVVLTINLVIQGITLVLGMMAPWFGPASLYFPTSLCSTLLSNMVIIGFILKREDLSKDIQVATYIIFLAVLLLPVVGPGLQEDQNIEQLLKRPEAVWLIFFVALFILSLTVITFKDLKKMKKISSEPVFATMDVRVVYNMSSADDDTSELCFGCNCYISHPFEGNEYFKW